MKDLRLLHVIDSLVAGGKERQFVELLKGLKAAPGFVVETVILSDVVEYDEFAGLGIRSHFVSRHMRYDPTVFARLGAVIRSFRPDIVHSWNSMCSVYAAPLAKLAGAKFVNGYVRAAPPRLSLRDIDHVGGKLTSPLSDVVVANSLAGLRAYGIRPGKGVCIYNGFDPTRLGRLDPPETVRRSLDIETPHVVGMVASFSERKDYATFLAAARTIVALRDDVTFLGIGDGPQLAKFIDTLSPDHRSRIKLPGRRSNVESIANVFSVGVLCSNALAHGEGISNALMEYMALGKPVVATDCGGNGELVENGRTGFLVRGGDPEALADRVLQLLDSPALARDMGENGLSRLQDEFSLERMTRAYGDLYRKLVSRRA